jgi:hypothetical protein
MWSINTVLITRVYMNLVWLAKHPISDSISMSTGMPMRTNVNTSVDNDVHMRVATSTEVRTDDDGNIKRPRPHTPKIGNGLEHGSP